MAAWMGNVRGKSSDSDDRLVLHWQMAARLFNSLRANRPREEIIHDILQQLPQLSTCAAGTIYLANRPAEDFVLAGAFGVTKDEFVDLSRIVISPSLLRSIILPENELTPQRTYRIRPNQYSLVASFTHARMTALPRATEGWTSHDTLLLLLRADASRPPVGILTLDSPEDPRFMLDRRWIDYLEQLADMSMTALYNAALYGEADQRWQTMESSATEIMRQVEQASRGNFTAKIPTNNGTLLDLIADQFNEMVRRIGDTISEMRDASYIIDQNALLVSQLATTVKEGAELQEVQINSAATDMRQVADSIEEMADKSVDASKNAETGREISENGRNVVDQTIAGMGSLREISLQTSQRISRLANSLQEIVTIIQKMRVSASEMNFLALNASIVASRTKDDSHSFEAIAQQIRNLAQSSSDSTTQIEERVLAIQTEAQVAGVAIEEMVVRVVEQTGTINESGATLLEIAETTERIDELNREIRDGARVQSAITKEVAQEISRIITVTGQTREGVQGITEAMAQLADLASTLRGKIGQFTLAGDSQPHN